MLKRLLLSITLAVCAFGADIQVIPMHFGAAQCASFGWVYEPCVQNLTVIVGSQDATLAAYQITVTYLDQQGNPQAQNQVVPRPPNGWAGARFLGDNITSIVVRVVGLAQSSNSTEVPVQ